MKMVSMEWWHKDLLTRSTESNVQENRMDMCKDLQGCTENKDKQEKKA
jgi:hypothetical protein